MKHHRPNPSMEGCSVILALLGRGGAGLADGAGAVRRHPCFVAFGATGLVLIAIVIALYALAAGGEQPTTELMSPAMVDLAEAAQLVESHERAR